MQYEVGTNKKEDQFLAIFTTLTLLQNAIEQVRILGKSFLTTDTTYKLIDGDKFLVTPIITQDIQRSPRLIALVLS